MVLFPLHINYHQLHKIRTPLYIWLSFFFFHLVVIGPGDHGHQFTGSHASELFSFRGQRLNSNKALSAIHRGSLLSEGAQLVDPPGVPFSSQRKAHSTGFVSLFEGVHLKLIKKN